MSNTRNSKIKRSSKIYTFKKRLYRLRRPSYAIQTYKQVFKIHIPPLLVIVRESNLRNSMKLRNGKVQDKKFKNFIAKI